MGCAFLCAVAVAASATTNENSVQGWALPNRVDLPLPQAPIEHVLVVNPGDILKISGMIETPDATNDNRKAGILLLNFRDKSRKDVDVESEDLMWSKWGIINSFSCTVGPSYCIVYIGISLGVFVLLVALGVRFLVIRSRKKANT